MQDYNREVVQTVTIPNVTANWAAWQFRNPPSLGSAAQRLPAAHAAAAGAERTASVQTADAAGSNPSARYFCGDWGALADLLEQRGLAGTYDVVLSAETIYSLDSMRSLYECIVRVSRALACRPGCAGQAGTEPAARGCSAPQSLPGLRWCWWYSASREGSCGLLGMELPCPVVACVWHLA